MVVVRRAVGTNGSSDRSGTTGRVTVDSVTSGDRTNYENPSSPIPLDRVE